MAMRARRAIATRWSRRTVLVSGIAAALAACLPWVAAGSPCAASGLFKHRASAAALGRRYLARYPADRAGALRLAEAMQAIAAEEARAWVRARIVADFRSGEVVELDGWRLARTECRLTALEAVG
ncbi:MAG: hypothetical protein EXQ96_03240 [Alphaproteobacteria bacterium]|nr:hypothetical protein [Alphaproteobacteria bacterium]